MVRYLKFLGLIILFTSCSWKMSNKALFRIIDNGLYGFVDSTGAVVITPQYKYISCFNRYGYATAITDYCFNIENGKLLLHIKYGFINKHNDLVVDTTCTMDLSFSQMIKLGISQDDALLYGNKFSKGELEFNDNIDGGFIQLRAGQYVVQNPKTKLMGFMNILGNTTVEAKYDVCHPFFGGVASVHLATKSISPGNLLEGLNSSILIDSLGNELTKERYFNIPNFSGIHYSWACKLITGEAQTPNFVWMLLDKNGKVCSDTLHCTHVYNSKSDYYIWQQTLFEIPFYSFVNKKGAFMTDFDQDEAITLTTETYSDVTSFSDTIAGVKVKYGEEPCWTFVNKKFEFISQPFDSVSTFNEEFAAVKEFSKDKTSSKWGFVNKNFKEVIPYKYDEVSDFIDGLAYFRIKNIEGYINKRGEVVWSHIK